MTNEVGKAIFAKAGELGVPVGFMCMKVLFFFSYDFCKMDLQLVVLYYKQLMWMAYSFKTFYYFTSNYLMACTSNYLMAYSPNRLVSLCGMLPDGAYHRNAYLL